MNTFLELKLPEALQRALQAISFVKPTPIQALAVPPALAGGDLIGCAQTGTGKTGAFCIPIFTRLLAEPGRNALVLVPTRELALQVEEFWRKLTRFSPELRSACLIGGAGMGGQLRQLRQGPRFIIATPGRLIDHLQSRNARLDRSTILVLDEADRMLDMGFAPQLNEIMRHVPAQRQTLLFTATWDAEMDRLSSKLTRNPAKVSVGTTSQAARTIEQAARETSGAHKNDLLLDEINRREGSILVFARTKSRTDRVARFLDSYGLDVARIHGGRSQGQRNAALAAFKQGDARILVATDIAARGIDVTGISHVVNYDLPQVPEDYIHRIGRTGRAGATGQAVSLVSPEEREQWRDILALLKKTGSALPQMMGGAAAPAPSAAAPASPAQSARDGSGSRSNGSGSGNGNGQRAQQRDPDDRPSGPGRGGRRRRRRGGADRSASGAGSSSHGHGQGRGPGHGSGQGSGGSGRRGPSSGSWSRVAH